MPTYRNLSGDSHVASYETDADSIAVTFRDGTVNLYNSLKPGRVHVEQMKKLATSGRGLNGYISGVVRRNFAKKLK